MHAACMQHACSHDCMHACMHAVMIACMQKPTACMKLYLHACKHACCLHAALDCMHARIHLQFEDEFVYAEHI